MDIKQMKSLVKEFGKSLDDKEKDEWWGTERDIWNDMGKRFSIWCSKNREKLQDDKDT